MNKTLPIALVSLLAGAALGAGGLLATRPDAPAATPPPQTAPEPGLLAENRALKQKIATLEEQRLLAEAAAKAPAAQPLAATEAPAPEAPDLNLEDLFGAMDWDDPGPGDRSRDRGRNPDGSPAPDGPGWEGGPWGGGGTPEERAARWQRFEQSIQERQQAFQDYLAEEAALSGDVAVQDRMAALSTYVDELQGLRQAMRETEDPEARDALRNEMRATQRAAQALLRDQQRHLLEQAAADAGLQGGQQRQLVNQVRDAMESPFFRLEPMLSGRGPGAGRRGGGGGGSGNAPAGATTAP